MAYYFSGGSVIGTGRLPEKAPWAAQQGRYAIEDFIKAYTKQYEAATAANLRRQQQIEAIFDEIIRRYGPGGTFGRAAEAQLERRKLRDVAAGMQQMVSSGLYGTTVAAALPKKWEEEVGAPARLTLEDIKMQRLSQAQLGKAGFLERIEDQYPSPEMLAQMMSAAGQAGVGAAPQTYRIPGWSTSSLKSSGSKLAGYKYVRPTDTGPSRGTGPLPGGGVYDPTIGQPVLGKKQIYLGGGKTVSTAPAQPQVNEALQKVEARYAKYKLPGGGWRPLSDPVWWQSVKDPAYRQYVKRHPKTMRESIISGYSYSKAMAMRTKPPKSTAAATTRKTAQVPAIYSPSSLKRMTGWR